MLVRSTLHFSVVLTLSSLASCAAPTNDGASAPADRAAKDAPVMLHCQLAHRESNALGAADNANDSKFRFETRTLEVRAGGSGSTSLAEMQLSAQYSHSPEEGTAFVISAAADGKQIVRLLRQFDDRDPVLRKFDANHGFTGLLYVSHPSRSDDYQFSCGTRPTSD